MLLDRVAEMFKTDTSNVTRILTQTLNTMDITDEKVIEVVPDSLKMLTSSVETVVKTTGDLYLFHKTYNTLHLWF